MEPIYEIKIVKGCFASKGGNFLFTRTRIEIMPLKRITARPIISFCLFDIFFLEK